MMKRRLLIWALALLIFVPTWLYSQVSAYQFSAVSGTYTAVSGGTDVDAIEADDIATSIPIGFTFNYDGVDYTDVVVSSNGWMSFNTSTSSTTGNDLDFSSTAIRPLLAPLWDDLDGRATGGSQASYIVTGTSPNQVLTMEWLNWEWRYSSTSPVVSFQVKLYETTNVIEFIYDDAGNPPVIASASIGITAAATGSGNYLSLDDVSAAPTASSTSETTTISTKPANGQIYRFSPPTCFQPTGLTGAAPTTTSVDLSWTAPTLGVPTNYEWEIVPDGNGQGVGVVSSGSVAAPTVTATAGSLTAATDYDAYVRTDCGGSDFSNYDGPYSFTTACPNFTPPYLEAFASYAPNCWEEAAGLLANPTVFTSTTTSDWIGDDFANVVGNGRGARVNWGDFGHDEWLISPTIDLGAGATDYQLEFDLAFTSSFGTGSVTMGADDKFSVIISTNNGVTWQSTNELAVYDNTTPISNTGTQAIVDLTGYTGLVKLAFYVESSTGGSFEIHIDNVVVDEVPACGDPTGLAATATSGSTADISWTAAVGTPDDYEWQVVPTGNAPGVGVVATGTTGSAAITTASATGLTALTDYDVYVRTSCAATLNTTYAGPASFTTLCATEVPPYTQDFTNGASTTCWTESEGDFDRGVGVTFTSTTAAGWVNAGFANSGSGALDNNMYGTGTSFDDEWFISPTFDFSGAANPQQLELDMAVTPYNSTAQGTFGTEDTFAIMVSVDDGATWDLLSAATTFNASNPLTNGLVTADLTAYAAETQLRFGIYAERTPGANSPDLDVSFDNFEILDIPSCGNPTTLSAAVTGAATADLSWTLGTVGTLTGHEWEVGATGFTPGTATAVQSGSVGAAATTANVTGLSLSTSYEGYVRTNCSSGDSPWEGPVAFEILPGDICATAIDLAGQTSPYSGTTVGYGALDISISAGAGCTRVENSANILFYIDVADGEQVTMGQSSNTFDSQHYFGHGLPAGVCPGTTFLDCVDTPDDQDQVYLNTTGVTQRVFYALGAYTASVTGTFTFEWELTNCFEPTAFTATAASATTADLAWTAPVNGTPTGYEYLIVLDGAGSAGTPQATSTPAGTSATAVGLTAETDYDAYVRTRCGVGNNSEWEGPISFATPCATIAPPYLEDFTAGVTASCWTESQGDFDQGVAFTSANFTSAFGEWATDGFGNVGTTGAVTQIMSGSDVDWFISPTIDLSGAANPQQLTFDASFTNSSSTALGTFTADDTVALMLSTDAGATWDFFSAAYVWNTANPLGLNEFITVDLTSFAAETDIRFAMYSERTPSSSSNTVQIHMDNFEIDDIPSCGDPTVITANATTGSTVDLSWTAPLAGTPDDYEYEIVPAGNGQGVGVVSTGTVGSAATMATATGLTAETDYDVYVRTSCAATLNASWGGPVSFTTPCATVTPPYLEDFTAGVSTNCWNEAQGDFDRGVGVTFTSTTSAGWVNAGFANTGSGALDNNVYGTGGDVEWFVSPTVDLSSAANPQQLEVDMAITPYNNSAQGTFGAEDTFAIMVSIDNGATWDLLSAATTFNVSNPLANGTVTADLSTYAAETSMKFALYIERTPGSNSPDLDASFDNFIIDDAPSCGDPTAVSAGGASATTANISWTAPVAGTPTDYEWEIVPVGNGQGVGVVSTGLVGGTGTSVTGVGTLTAQTDYDAYVRTVCGVDNSAWVGPVSFSTPCPPITAFPWTETFEPASTTEACWRTINNNDTWILNSSTSNTGAEAAAIDTDGGGTTNDDWLITPQLTLTGNEVLKFYTRTFSSFEPNEFEILISSGSSDAVDFTTTIQPLLTIGHTTYQEYTVNLTAYSGNHFIGFHIPSGVADGWVLYVDDVTIEPAPSCSDPTDLTATSTSASTADLNWTVGIGTTHTWEVGTAGFAPGTGAEFATGTTGALVGTASVSGLALNQAYEAYVNIDCNASTWEGPFAFTILEGDICATAIDLGAQTSPYSGTTAGFTANDITITASSGCTRAAQSANVIFYIDVADGEELSLRTDGTFDSYHYVGFGLPGGTCPGATQLTCADTDDRTTTYYNSTGATQRVYLVQGRYSSTGSATTFDLIWETYSCFPPTSLVEDAVAGTTIDFSFTAPVNGTPAGYEFLTVFDGAGTAGVAQASGSLALATTGQATGLAGATAYDTYVRTDCGAGDFSEWVGPLSSTTDCVPLSLPYAQDFNASGINSPCWVESDGDFEDHSGVTFTSTTTSGWTTDGFGNSGTTGALRQQISGFDTEWVISPEFDFTTDADNQQVEFDIALTTANGSGVGTFNSEDTLAVMVSTDGGTTWARLSAATTFHAGNTFTNGDRVIADMTAYAAQASIFLAFYSERSPSSFTGTLDIHIDNFEIKDIPNCGSPLGFAATVTGSSTADLSWTVTSQGAVSGHEWILVADGAGSGATPLLSGTASAAATSASITGMTLNTAYDAYLRTECGTGVYSAYVGPIDLIILPGDICATAIDLSAQTSPATFNTTGYTAGDINFSTFCSRAENSENMIFYLDVAVGEEITITTDGAYDAYSYVGFDLPSNACPGGTQTNCTDANTATEVLLNNTAQTQRVYLVQGGWNPGDVGSFELTWLIESCFEPTGLGASLITATTADVTWTPDASATTGHDWVIVLDGAGSAGPVQASGSTTGATATATATGLTAQTDYDLYVRSDCGGGDVSPYAGPFSFTTSCPAFTPPYTEDFTSMSSSSAPNCWSEAAGPVANPTVFTSSTTSFWTNDGLGNVGSTGAAKINIYTTDRDEWLISPSIDLGTGTTTYKVGFDHANTNFGSTVQSTLNNDDRVLLLISTDNGVTWNESDALRTWDASSSIADLNGNFEYVLNGYTGVVKFAIYAESFVSGGDEDFSIDNFVVEEFICTDGYWEGTVNTDWTNAGNWCNGTVPTNVIDVTIPPNVPNYPDILDGQTVFANSIDISNGGVINFTPSVFAGTPSYGTLEVAGDIANSGTLNSGNVTMNGSGPQTITGSSNFFDLRIENSAGVSIGGGTQSIFGGLILIDGVFTSNNSTTIKSTADRTGYIDDFTDATPGTISGLVRTERYVNNTHNGFSFIGANVTTSSIGDWSGEFSTAGINGGGNFSFVLPTPACDPNELRSTSPYGGLFDYVENVVTTCNQAGWRVRTGGSLNPTDGYAGVIPNGTVADLFGFAATGSQTTGTLTYTTGNTSGSVGFNMIANPYPSSINWTDVAAANPGIQGAAYVFQASGPYLGTYVAVNSLSPAHIGSGQAFFVEVDNGVGVSTTVSFDNTMRETGSDAFFKSGAAYDAILKLDVVGNGHADKTTIAFGENFVAGRDRDYDAGKMASMPGYAMLYTATNPDYVQAINALPIDGSVNVIPMGFKPGADGSYTFTATDLETFAPTSLIILEDKLTGTFQNLMENDTYTFTSDEMDDEMRFNIHFIPATAYDVTDVDCQGTDGSVLVDFGTHAIGANTFAWDAYEVTDAAGNVLSNGTSANGSVTVANLPVGTYTLAVSFGNYSVTDEITVDAAPQVTAAFTADNLQPGTGELVNFTNTTPGATTYEWNMGDGTTYTGVANPSHIYNAAGIYEVELLVSNDDCSDRIVQTVEVQRTTGIPTLQNDGYRLFSFDDQLRIEFADYNTDTKVDMYIYDMLGKEIAVEKGLTTGNSQYQFSIDANADVTYYIVRLVGEKTNVSRTVSFSSAR